MTAQINDKLITIIPKSGYLRSEQLIALRHDQPITIECDSVSANGAGLKKTMPNGTDEEAETLQHLYEQLEKQLSKPRIERLAGRTLAEWDENFQAVRIIRKDGKFQNFGYNYQGQHYLDYYEAMFLLEMNRLQLEYYGQIISIEQAYILLLGETATEKYSNYLIYSYLTRAGYILKKFRNIYYCNDVQMNRSITTTTTTATTTQANDVDCIWYIFEQELQSKNHEISKNKCESKSANQSEKLCKNMTNYIKFKEQFQQFKKQIMNPTTSAKAASTTTTTCKAEEHREVVEKFSWQLDANRKFQNKLKRSANVAGISKTARTSEWQNIKRFRDNQTTSAVTPGANTTHKSLLDFLDANEMFTKFDIIPMKHYEKWDDEDEEDIDEEYSDNSEKNIIKDAKKAHNINVKLIISFDVYLPRGNFRKSDPGPPDFRVIILKPNQAFPTHQQIYKIYWQQLQQITLVIMAVNESKQVQAFLYYFS